MRHLVRQEGLADAIVVESAGTGGWHVGELRDQRSRGVGERRGIPLSGRGQQFTARDFERFDYVVAMDRQNLAALTDLAPTPAASAKLSLLRAHDVGSVGADLDVPDPYYSGPEGFELVFDICLSACRGLLESVRDARSA